STTIIIHTDTSMTIDFLIFIILCTNISRLLEVLGDLSPKSFHPYHIYEGRLAPTQPFGEGLPTFC
ncbi:MAG: hypothetical protein LBU34_01050, partial [Planctomycetaceae bacterium]|nr:hypothetical protein [Planctomycetaceae bacterium]